MSRKDYKEYRTVDFQNFLKKLLIHGKERKVIRFMMDALPLQSKSRSNLGELQISLSLLKNHLSRFDEGRKVLVEEKLYKEAVWSEIFPKIDKLSDELPSTIFLSYTTFSRYQSDEYGFMPIGTPVPPIRKKAVKLSFDLDALSIVEITDCLALLSELYTSLGGDYLEIKSDGIFELAANHKPVSN